MSSMGSDTNWAVQPQKVASGLKLRILEVGDYYLCSEGKGADQLSDYRASYLRGYRAGDLQLRFREKKQQQVFS